MNLLRWNAHWLGVELVKLGARLQMWALGYPWSEPKGDVLYDEGRN